MVSSAVVSQKGFCTVVQELEWEENLKRIKEAVEERVLVEH